MHKYEGSFPIIGRVDNVSYTLQLSVLLNIHNVFHMRNLVAYHLDLQDASRSVPTQLPSTIASFEKWVKAYKNLSMHSHLMNSHLLSKFLVIFILFFLSYTPYVCWIACNATLSWDVRNCLPFIFRTNQFAQL